MREKILQRGLAMALSAAMLLTGIQIPRITAEAADAREVVFIDDMEEKTTEEAGWTVSGWQNKTDSDVEERTVNEWAKNNKTKWWQFKTQSAAQTLTISKTIANVEPGDYMLSVEADGDAAGKVNLIEVNETGSTDTDNKVSKDMVFGAWDAFETTVTDKLTLAQKSSLRIEFIITSQEKGWFDLDNIQLIREKGAAEIKAEAVEALSSLITDCRALTQNNYLPKGWSALQTEIQAAEGVRDTAASTMEDIVKATEKLQLAKASLISIVPEEDAGLFVKKVDNLSEDFVRGVDISTYKSLIDSGVKFKGWNGEELDEVGFFKLLKSAGVNYVRIRVWNDPYADEAKTQGYGAGNCDVAKAAQMGAWATKAGLKVMVDFHYSDFWADPGRQVAPKAWKDFTVDQKADAVKTFTKESLETIIAAGADVGMVQVGNETTSGICGESNWDDMVKIFKAGCAGVKDADSSILRVLHFTNPEETGRMKGFADKLATAEVDYDVFASSYYPYWHGTRENLTAVLKYVADKYSKKVMVAETSWARTLEDGDGQPNVVRVGNNDDTSVYSASPQGQANEVRDVIEAVANVGDAGIGVMYWEPAWLPVNVYDEKAGNAAEVLAANKKAWDDYGSGWASSYSIDYDPNVTQSNYGGSEWDNQAMFDFYGNPLPSLNVYKYVFSGASGEKKLVSIEESSAKVVAGTDIAAGLPATVIGVFNDSSKEAGLPVTWSTEDIAAIDGFGTFTVNGTVTYGTGEDAVTLNAVCKVNSYPDNLLQQGDFESGYDKWTITGEGENHPRDYENPRNGQNALAFYKGTAFEMTVSQSITAEQPGTFGAFLYVQGGNPGQVTVKVKLSNDTQGTSSEGTAGVNGWREWQNPSVNEFVSAAIGDTLTVTITITGEAGSWGSIDDVFLYQKSVLAPTSYKITYELNGGTNDNKNPATYYNQKVTLKNATRKGYTFGGWYSDSKFKKKVTGIDETSTGDITLYAKWVKVKVNKASVKTVKNNAKKKAKVTIKKVTGAKGYQVQYSADKKFKKGVKTTKPTTKMSVTLGGLKKGKTYYVRVCAYKLDSKKQKVFGKYGAAKNVKIKK